MKINIKKPKKLMYVFIKEYNIYFLKINKYLKIYHNKNIFKYRNKQKEMEL